VKIYDESGDTEDAVGAADSIPRCLDPIFAPTPTPPPSPTPTPTARPTATPLYRLLNVYFVNPSLELAAGKRWSVSSSNLAEFVVDQYFRGPGYVEKHIYRWTAPVNGATGYTRLEVSNGIARLYLKGGCESTGSASTLAAPLTASLKQFPSIQYVKIYDPNGETQDPSGQGDSTPACLQP
jgi:hypothetical protein